MNGFISYLPKFEVTDARLDLLSPTTVPPACMPMVADQLDSNGNQFTASYRLIRASGFRFNRFSSAGLGLGLRNFQSVVISLSIQWQILDHHI